MHRHPTLSRLVALVTAGLLVAACAGDGELTLDDARSRMSPMFAGVGAVYLDITNGTDADDRLVGASVDAGVAASVEIHETFDADEMAADAPDHATDEEGAGADGSAGDGMDGDGMDDTDGEGMEGMDGDGMDGGAEPSPEGFAMMGMREIEALAVPAGETVELVPGGYHLMLIDLATDLEVGQEFELVLEFEHAGTRTVTVTVRDDV